MVVESASAVTALPAMVHFAPALAWLRWRLRIGEVDTGTPPDENPSKRQAGTCVHITPLCEVEMKPWNFKSKSKSRRNASPTKQPGNQGMPKIRPLVAGIDVGSEKHFVCAPTSDGGTEMRVFGTSTPDLQAILEWLQEAHVES